MEDDEEDQGNEHEELNNEEDQFPFISPTLTMISIKQKEMMYKELIEDAEKDETPHEMSKGEEEKHEESQDAMSQRKSENKKLQKHDKEHKRKK